MVFDKNWFIIHQKKLLWIASSFLGRAIFRYKKMGLTLEKSPIIKITPNSVAQYVWFQNRIQIREHFFNRNEYALKLRFWLYPLWYAMHLWDLFADRYASQLSFGFATLTKNSDASTGATTVDGQVDRDSVDQTWTNIRAGAGTGNNATGVNQALWEIIGSATADQFQTLLRFICTFDTSSLGSSAVITTATLSFYGTTVRTDAATPGTNVVSSTPAANNNLANSDYSQLGSTAFSTAILNSAWSTTGYNDFVLNASGRANISLTGISKFGVRESQYDITGTDPGNFTNGGTAYAQAYTADNATNKPKLVITYGTNYTISLASGSYTLTGHSLTLAAVLAWTKRVRPTIGTWTKRTKQVLGTWTKRTRAKN